jgi:tetratricopeptide (TPR) repeat protein
LLQTLAVIGTEFPLSLVRPVVQLLPDQLDRLLISLQAGELVYEQPAVADVEYAFKHAVIQDVAYSSLLLQRRKELHRAVGRAIEELYRDRLAEHYPELAYHFRRGEDWSRAMEYSRLAGDQCSHSFANAEAIEHYAHPIDAAAKLPITGSGAVGDLHARRGGVLSIIGRHQEAIDEYAHALDCARSGNDRTRECRFLFGLSLAQFNAHHIEAMLDISERSGALAKELGEVAIQASSTIASALARGIWDGATPEIIEQAEEAVRLAETLTDPRLLAQTTVTLGQLLQWHGEFERAFGHLHKGLELAREAHSAFAFGQSLFSLGNLSLSRGEYEQALGWYQQLNDYAQAAGDAFWLARIPNCTGAVSLELYDLERALELQLEGDEAARKYSAWPEPRGHSLLKAGLVHLERTDYGRAEEFFLRAWALLEIDDVSRYRWHIPLLYARGALALACGRHDEAGRFATESLALARKTHSRKHEAPAQRLQGEILAATGRLKESAPILDASVTLARRLKVPRDEWMGALALGRLLLRLGEDKEAEVALNTAAATIGSIAAGLKTDVLSRSFVAAPPVLEVFKVLGRRPPVI